MGTIALSCLTGPCFGRLEEGYFPHISLEDRTQGSKRRVIAVCCSPWSADYTITK